MQTYQFYVITNIYLIGKDIKYGLSYFTVLVMSNIETLTLIFVVFTTDCSVCVRVEVLRPSQPNEVMLSVVSLPNPTFTGQA